MIRRHMIMSAAAATFALASCSGSDDPTPTPSPTATPTPTPTASPTYAVFPLTAAAEFGTINGSISYTGDPAGAVTLGAAATDATQNRVKLATSNAFDTATYVINEAGEESRFVKANATTQPVPTTTEFVFRTTDTATAGKFSQLEFLNNTISATTRTNDANLQLTNVSYANWWRGDSTTGAKRITTSVFGYQTIPTDMPPTGAQAYTSTIVGRLVDVTGGVTTVSRVGGTVTVSVNFSTGVVDISLNLNRTPEGGGATTAYGTFTAQGAIPTKESRFNASFAGSTTLSGTFVGAFFGSQAKEIGIAFSANGTVGGGSQRLAGVIVGKK
ncbi:hypothetical protein MZO42_12935 [Sphingomonas psychrotolerans]|uniref:Transferrin-binding protein B C-lobe/N-lobe beta barrel domain-containing protein n=1 Tax=Sphingomonas psychrotolerans TaxID=1327635 RepID=A0ABU3N505_9SPHN|nr:hypothetical protein [Sphingomonas psychrotolerans]MDT8759604.1 hypothetical protein [Sphingomonas psychrotolerans]